MKNQSEYFNKGKFGKAGGTGKGSRPPGPSRFNKTGVNKFSKTGPSKVGENKVENDSKERYERWEKHDPMGVSDHILYIGRVVKVVKGGRRFSFNAVAVAGDGQGKIGIGLGKGVEITNAIQKATEKAKKYLKPVVLSGTTIPHTVIGHYGSSKVILKPAADGVGLVASGVVRLMLTSVGIKNVVSKCIGRRNVHNVTKATLEGLLKLRSIEYIEKRRGKGEPNEE